MTNISSSPLCKPSVLCVPFSSLALGLLTDGASKLMQKALGLTPMNLPMSLMMLIDIRLSTILSLMMGPDDAAYWHVMQSLVLLAE